MYKRGDKFEVRGVKALSDLELLILILGGISRAESVAEQLFVRCGGDLKELLDEDLNVLRMVDGLDQRGAERIVAAIELGQRISRRRDLDVEIGGSEDAVVMFRQRVQLPPYEECWVMHLNGANRLVEIQRVSQGGLSATTVDNRLIMKRSLELLSTKLILVHNHPSGALQPSQADLDITEELRRAAALFNVDLVDHIIVSTEGYFSITGAACTK
ncbi:MAG: JAB domain-containing protein [Rikenellaceae bacterium]